MSPYYIIFDARFFHAFFHDGFKGRHAAGNTTSHGIVEKTGKTLK